MNIRACFGAVQFRWGHGASSNCRLPHVPQAICWHSAPSHRGFVLLHPSCVVGRASCTCALNLIVAFSPQDSCAHGSHIPLTVLVVGDFIHGHHAPWANGWHGKLGHRALRACMSRVFCWSGKPGHGGDLRTIGCDAGRWLAQPLGAQSPFTSPRCLTVRANFARGCG